MTALLALAVGLLALTVRVLLVARAATGMAGIDGYDGGVYYAASTSLLWGRVPYEDFVLLHPPGIMLLLMPFAVLGRLTSDTLGFEAARGVSLLVGAVNATLLVVLVRRAGLGRGAAAVAGVLYAVWTPAAMAETTIRLEPWVTLGLLAALLLLLTPGRPPSSWHLLLAGCCLGSAFSVKIWAVAPALFVLLWCWRRWGHAALARMLLGVGLAVTALDLPFLAAAPAVMWRMVVLDQLGRQRTRVSIPQRLTTTLLDGRPIPLHSAVGREALVVLVLVGSVVLVGALRTSVGRFAVGLLAVQLVVLALSPSFYSYYPAFAAPTIALLAGAAVGGVVGLAHQLRRGRLRGPIGGTASAVVSLATAAGVLVVLGVAYGVDGQVVVRRPFPATVIASDAARARCVTSDSPDALLLTNLFSRDLLRGCPAPVDLSGLRFDVDASLRPDGRPYPRAHNRRWQRTLVSYLRDGQMIFVMRSADDGVSALLRHRVLRLPTVAAGAGYRLFDNDGGPLRSPRRHHSVRTRA